MAGKGKQALGSKGKKSSGGGSLKELWAQFREGGLDDDFGDAIPVDNGKYTGQLVGGEVKDVGDAKKAVVKWAIIEDFTMDDAALGKIVTEFWNIEHVVGFKIALQTLKKLGCEVDDIDDEDALQAALNDAIERKVAGSLHIVPRKDDESQSNVRFKRMVEVDDALLVDPEEALKPMDDGGAEIVEEEATTEEVVEEQELSVGSTVSFKVKGKEVEGEVTSMPPNSDKVQVTTTDNKKMMVPISIITITGHALDGGEVVEEEVVEEEVVEQEPAVGDRVVVKVKGKPQAGSIKKVDKRKGTVDIKTDKVGVVSAKIADIEFERD